MARLPSDLHIDRGLLLINGALIYENHVTKGERIWIDLVTKANVVNAVEVKLMLLFREMVFLTPAEQLATQTRIGVLVASRELILLTQTQEGGSTRWRDMFEAFRLLDKTAQNYKLRSLLPLQLFRATSFLRPIRGAVSRLCSADAFAEDKHRAWHKLAVKAVALVELETKVEMIRREERYVVFESWHDGSQACEAPCLLHAARILLTSTVTLHDIAGAYQNIVRFSECHDLKSSLGFNLIRNLRGLKSSVRELLVWQTCIEVPDALTDRALFDKSLFQQVLKPVFFNKNVMMWEPRCGHRSETDDRLQESIHMFSENRMETVENLTNIYPELHMSFQKAMAKSARLDCFVSRSGTLAVQANGSKRPARERASGPIPKVLADLHLRARGGTCGVSRVLSPDTQRKRRRLDYMTACFLTPQPVSGSLGRLQGVRLIVDLTDFMANWQSGANFFRAQRRAFAWFMELTGHLLAPKDVASVNEFLFECSSELVLKNTSIRVMNTTYVWHEEIDVDDLREQVNDLRVTLDPSLPPYCSNWQSRPGFEGMLQEGSGIA